jgi:acetoin utilization deacetylase AcuC-like enzyme
MIKVNESNVKLGQHSDTSFSAGSLRAARRAAGAVQHAVDCVLVGRQRNAFCLVRPPGHHAGINGLLDGGESCGFCIFNSIAAGAMHAISDERLLCERCAIVDLDVHHGNGTEEIVRNCHDPSKLFFFSIHLYDNDRKGKRETKSFQYKFYPGTGDEDDLPLNIINVPITPLWKEQGQRSVGGGTHNTRHRTRNRLVQSDDGDSSEAGTPRVSDAELESRISSGASSPVPQASANGGGLSGRHAYRKSIQNRLLPALRAFNPDLILISAGFDACKGDVGNAKHEVGGNEKMGIDLEPEDYAWTTRKVLEIADICCQGRVVSVLEGGYGRHPTTGMYDPTQPLDKSLFSDCAIRHIHAMIDPYNVEGRFGSSRN